MTQKQILQKKLYGLQKAPNRKKIATFSKELKKLEQESKIELSDKQMEALEAVNDNNVCIITGGPGTGKTTVIKSILEVYQKKGKK